MRLCDELEAAWTKIQQDLSVGGTPNYIYKSGDMEVSIDVFKYVLCGVTLGRVFKHLLAFQPHVVSQDAS